MDFVSRPRKWLQNSERNILIGPETESLVVKHFRHVAVADPKFSAKSLPNPDLYFQQRIESLLRSCDSGLLSLEATKHRRSTCIRPCEP
jgi:hypothetical protein